MENGTLSPRLSSWWGVSPGFPICTGRLVARPSRSARCVSRAARPRVGGDGCRMPRLLPHVEPYPSGRGSGKRASRPTHEVSTHVVCRVGTQLRSSQEESAWSCLRGTPVQPLGREEILSARVGSLCAQQSRACPGCAAGGEFGVVEPSGVHWTVEGAKLAPYGIRVGSVWQTGPDDEQTL